MRNPYAEGAALFVGCMIIAALISPSLGFGMLALFIVASMASG